MNNNNESENSPFPTVKKGANLPRIFQLAKKPELGTAEALNALHEQLGVILPEYDEFVTQYGRGLFSYFLRIYLPQRIIEENNEFRARWSEYFLWDDEGTALSEEDTPSCTILGDTIIGDEFVYFPGSPSDETKKPGIYILPREEYCIHYIGQDLTDILSFLRNAYDDFPADNYWLEGYIDIVRQAYKCQNLNDSFGAIVDRLRTCGNFVHEIVSDEDYVTFFSEEWGGLLDFSMKEKEVFIRCNKDTDLPQAEQVLTAMKFKQTQKDHPLFV